jgi:hypothetical protein
MTPRALLALPMIFAAHAAFAEGEQAASVGLGWATFSTPGKKMGTMEPPAVTPDIGGALSLIYERALSTDFSLRGEGVFGTFYGGATGMQSNMAFAGLADAGVLFRFDILKYVPYAFGGVGGVLSTGGPIDHAADFVVVLGGGLDILSSRKRSWGFEARLASFGGDITVFTLGARATVRWDYL